MIDFKQKTDDGYAAGKACREWEEEQNCAVIDLEKNIFIEAFKRGLRHERKSWQRKYREQVDYSVMYRERLQAELDSKHQEKSYREMADELKKAEATAECCRKDMQKYYGLYMTMVEGADYNTIERHVFLKVLKELGIDAEAKYKEIMQEAEQRYKERYPNRK